MYAGKVDEERYLKIVECIKSVPEELKHEPVVMAFNHLANLILDYLAPRLKQNPDGTKPLRDFEALAKYMDKISRSVVDANNNADDARQTINALVSIFDKVKSENDVFAQQIPLLQEEIKLLSNELQIYKREHNALSETFNKQLQTELKMEQSPEYTPAVTFNTNNIANSVFDTVIDNLIVDKVSARDFTDNVSDNTNITEQVEPFILDEGTALIIKEAKKVRGGRK